MVSVRSALAWMGRAAFLCAVLPPCFVIAACLIWLERLGVKIDPLWDFHHGA